MKKERYRRKITFEKKNIGSRPGSPGLPGHGSTGVLPGCCTGRFFNKPGPVQPPD
jgi:hypothetical protein